MLEFSSDLTPILILLAVTFVATAVHTSTSFGFGIITIMFFPYLLPNYPTATACVTLLTLAFSSINSIRMRKEIVWAWIVPTFVSYFIASFFAVRLLNVIDDVFMKKVLGVVLVCLSLYFIFFQKRIHMEPTKRNGFIAGLMSGTLESLFCVGGPPIVLYLLTVSKDVRRYTASVQAWFAVTETFLLFMRFINGHITPVALHFSAIGFLAIPPGIYLGTKLLDHMNPQRLKNIVYGIMLFYGFLLIFK